MKQAPKLKSKQALPLHIFLNSSLESSTTKGAFGTAAAVGKAGCEVVVQKVAF
ncbi:hypothetical protein MA16_Dca000783 [Dendrobium catenatum]|uniref:Uncharacterized protein n=1 Tax=Dendrobium catenatum TaxID=906689 RepID=A0A2I0WUU9_9ASPA|nr:hypothetical protein MA16_Dca000783 [Dendrobium catenatum]